jgi:hypothetical protein
MVFSFFIMAISPSRGVLWEFPQTGNPKFSVKKWLDRMLLNMHNIFAHITMYIGAMATLKYYQHTFFLVLVIALLSLWCLRRMVYQLVLKPSVSEISVIASDSETFPGQDKARG